MAAEITEKRKGFKDLHQQHLQQSWHLFKELTGWTSMARIHKELLGKRAEMFPTVRKGQDNLATFSKLAMCQGKNIMVGIFAIMFPF